MANIALDIRANTQKALGEFKKLSRELDNKFLIQGLKLDVVKSAFRDITKEFDKAVGEQGLKAESNVQQLRRNLALNLSTFKKFGDEASVGISKEILNSLRDLQAEGKITEQSLKESLDVASFFDFAGTESERKAAFKNFAQDFAIFSKETKNLFDESDAGLIKRVVTGQTDVTDLLNVDFGQGGAVSNRLAQIIRERLPAGAVNIQSIDPQRRGAVVQEVLETFRNDPVIKRLRADLERENPFLFLESLREQLFSPKGLFGNLRSIGGQISNFENQLVDRNLLQLTGKLIKTIFDPKEGLFAVLFNSVGTAFGFEDPLAPILSGVELFTSFIKKLTNFFGSGEFKSILGIFDPLVNAVKSIASGNEFNFADINTLISGIFESIRNAIQKITEYIKSADEEQIGSIISNILSEIGKTIPPLIDLVFSSIGKLVESAFKGFQGADAGGKGVLLGGLAIIFRKQIAGLIGGIFKQFTGGRGIVELLQRQLGIGAAGRQAREERGIMGPGGFNAQVISRMDAIIRLLGGYQGPSSPLELGNTDPNRGGPRDGGDRERDTNGRRKRRPGTKRRYIRSKTSRFGRRVGGFLDDAGYVGRELVGGVLEDFGDIIMGNDYLDDYDRNIDSPEPRKGERVGRDGRTSRQRALDMKKARGGRFGRLLRGTGGLTRRVGGGILGGAITALTLSSILSGGEVQASEMEGLSPEEQRQISEERRKSARQEAGGAIIGAAGGALGGALGSVFGPAGTIIGGMLGEMAGSALASAPFMEPINEGLGKLAEDIGSWVGKAWEGAVGFGLQTWNKLGEAWKSITGFFGEEGPIMMTWKRATEIKDNVVSVISSGWDDFKTTVAGIPGVIGKAFVNFFSRTNQQNGRALGGVGTGLTLVGENGPELADLGTGSVVYPQTSWAGLGMTKGGLAQKDVTNNVTININAPGAEFFANEMSQMVLAKLDEIYDNQRLLNVSTTG